MPKAPGMEEGVYLGGLLWSQGHQGRPEPGPRDGGRVRTGCLGQVRGCTCGGVCAHVSLSTRVCVCASIGVWGPCTGEGVFPVTESHV